MAYLKLMLDEKEIAHLSEDGQYLCANEGVPQYDLPLNLFIGSSRKVPLVDVVVWAKKRIFPPKPDGLQGDSGDDGPARLQCVGNRQAHQCLLDGGPFLAAFQRS